MKTVTGLILAGGRGQRMGGADKGWVIHEGKPLIVAVVERLKPQVGPLLISANRNVERYAALGEVVADEPVGAEPFAGPLVGVLSGLRRAGTAWVSIVPCDAPNLPSDLVQRLMATIVETDAAATCARVNGRLQPVFALVKTETATELKELIGQGERAMHVWLQSIGATATDFDDADAFVNINTPSNS